MSRGADSTIWAAFAAAVVIGGANFIAVSVSNEELPPLFGATLRFGVGALLFLLLARARHVPLARGRAAAGAALYGVFGFGMAYALLYYSLVGLGAGTVAVIIATVPLFTLIIAIGIGQERPSWRGMTGGLLAVAGIAVLSLGTLGSAGDGGYLVAAILGAVAIAAAGVVAKSYPGVHPLNMNAIGMVAATPLLAAGSRVLGEAWRLPAAPRTWLAVAWLVLLGSMGLFQLYLYVIRRWTASATSYIIAGMPVVAVGLGALLLQQPVTAAVLVGGSLVVAAVYVGAIAAPQAAARVPSAPAVAPAATVAPRRISSQ
jgi:drug/metabolite transporter (DMT)-like permease